MNLLITICARGGSKGIPGKNIRPLNGTPLIVYTLRHARAYAEKTGADVELSTDDTEIKRVAAEAGLTTAYTRPGYLATDNAGKLDAIKDILQYAERARGKRYEFVLDLDVTSPLRTIEDLDVAFRMLQANPRARNLFSVSPTKHNPYFDIVEETPEGFVDLVKRPKQQMLARQEGPHVYELNASFYIYYRSFFDEDPLVLIKNSLMYIMPHMCCELDEEVDFSFLEYLLRHGNIDVNFQWGLLEHFAGVRRSFEGQRIVLRTMEESDATERYASWLNDPEVNRFLATKSATMEELRAYITQKNSQKDAVLFGVFLKDNGAHIGTVKLEPLELTKKQATIAVMIGDKSCWGKGYAGEAMQLLIEWCFTELGCTEVNLGVVAKNAAAIRTYEKLGFRETRRDPGYVQYGDEVHDQVWMALKRDQLSYHTLPPGSGYTTVPVCDAARNV